MGAPLAAGQIRRTLIESRPATGLDGWETRLYLIEYGPGAVAPLHVHPAVGVGRVLEGMFESAFGDEPVVRVRAGEGFVDPAAVPHRVFRNVDAAHPLRFVVAYTIRAKEQIVYPGPKLPASPPPATPPLVSFGVAPELQTIDKPGLYPETIDYDPKTARFIVGSFRDGAIDGIAPSGAVSRVVDDPRLCSVLGIAVDASRQRVWATNADLGLGVKRSPAGPKALAAVGVYDLEGGKPVAYVDLTRLAPGPHLLNGIALDADGSAYVTDSFAKAIYKVTSKGEASLLVTSERVDGAGVNLNGLVVHPGGYLLVVKKSDGALFRVPLANPSAFSEVKLERPLLGGDGLVLAGTKELVVIANKTPNAKTNAAFALSSADDWASATVRAVEPLGDGYPTTAVLRDGSLFVLQSQLDELLGSSPEQRPKLNREATIRRIGTIGRPQP